MPPVRTLADRLYRAAQSVEAARVHTAGPMMTREKLQLAVRELADALENVAVVVEWLHDLMSPRSDEPLPPGNP